jgi:hypothetical protein
MSLASLNVADSDSDMTDDVNGKTYIRLAYILAGVTHYVTGWRPVKPLAMPQATYRRRAGDVRATCGRRAGQRAGDVQHLSASSAKHAIRRRIERDILAVPHSRVPRHRSAAPFQPI